MGRPPLPVGAHGNMTTTVVYQARVKYRDQDGVTRYLERRSNDESKAIDALFDAIAKLPHATGECAPTVKAVHQARARYRDRDGVTRDVVRYGPSDSAAKRELRAALATRTHSATEGDLSRETTVKALGAMWLEQVEASDRAESTKARYRYLVEAHINTGMGGLRLREVSVGLVDRLLKDVTARHGYATAKTVRACLSAMLGVAVRHDVLASNPVAGAADIPTHRAPVRALTRKEAGTLMRKLRADAKAVEHDLPDLVAFMLATGVRIGEALAVRTKDVDLRAGTVEIRATVTDQGRQERTKTAAGWRVLALPPATVAMIEARIENPRIETGEVLFPSPLGKVRDTSNTAAHLRRAFDGAGFAWLRPHGLRKSVATWLDEAGLSARQVADQLGHQRPSMTQDVYMGRRVTVSDAARLLAVPEK